MLCGTNCCPPSTKIRCPREPDEQAKLKELCGRLEAKAKP